MEIELKIPTEQYAYIGLKLADKEVLTQTMVDTAINYYTALKTQYMAFNATPEGLTAKELDLIIEKMCLGVTVEGGTELWSKASQAQKDQINCLKRALSRIKAKHNKKKDEEDEAWEGAGPGKGENGDYSSMD